MRTIFFERSGEDAREVLEAFHASLSDMPGCQEVKLLESAQQTDLYLLVTTWADGGEPPETPDGTKLWIFQDI